MLKKIFLSLAVIVVAFLIVAALQPADFRVTRAATVAAPPAQVFSQINDLHHWNAWSPWARLDPNAKNTFDGPAAGVGAGFGWAGNSEVGEGHMTITESQPNERIVMKLEFVKPFAGVNITEFTFHPEGDQTAVSWTMTGRKNFIAKAMGLVIDCDKMVGDQFEQGFKNLNEVVSAPAGS
ncbi:MAG: SRPBCC family protein [Chthoniobacteraceae bacterium]